MDRLENVTQPYAWGSTQALAQLEGRPPSEKPEAEVWMGAHPIAPSKTGRGSLEALIAQAPERELGAGVVKRFGPRLPYLLKLLAAAQPLSLQAHPSLAQAKEGFARENQAGIPLSSPERNYKDDNHKPELICAVTPFAALCGFRELSATVALIDAIGSTPADGLFGPLREGELELCFRAVLDARQHWSKDRQREAVAALSGAASKLGSRFAMEATWTPKIAALYPDDLAVAATLLLNHIELQPMQAIYLPAGNLHAYLSGLGVEIMAASDNVLRGGLTPKHVDVPELLKVLEFKTGPVSVLEAKGKPEGVYETPAPEFQLSRFEVKGRVEVARRGPEIWVCTRGQVTVGSQSLRPGQSAYSPASDGPFAVDGDGEVFRSTVND